MIRRLGGRRAGRALALCLALLVGCAAATQRPAEPRPRGEPDSDLLAHLVALGEEALEQGELDAARSRFERALTFAPGSTRARAGLGRALLRAGDFESAEAELRAALARDADEARAHLGLAELAVGREDSEAALEHAKQAVNADPLLPEAHALLEGLTGRAPRTASTTPAQALSVAQSHPYDPYAHWVAGEALLRIGRTEAAARQLEQAVWVADRDPVSAQSALRRLTQIDPQWSERRVVWVHTWADESVRAHPGWRYRLRLVWMAQSRLLSSALGVWFVPRSIREFDSSAADASLESIAALFRARPQRDPRAGVLAVLTERRPPRRRAGARLGQAEFLGRRLVARLHPGELESRVLAHEILHLYGGVHVSDELESLMNPSGRASTLDPVNLRIALAMRSRRFGPRGLDGDVLPFIDVPDTIEAYQEALRVNLVFRRMGIREALEEARGSRVLARELRGVTALDPHLGDVSRFLARLLDHEGRRAEAIVMLDLAGRLYGPETPQGRETIGRADLLRRSLRAREHGGETGRAVGSAPDEPSP